MDYVSYLKNELQNILFVEIKKDVNLNGINLTKGEYPVHSVDFVKIAKGSSGNIPASAIINGIVYVLACDKEFKYNKNYISILKEIKGIESYLIMEIEKDKKTNEKKSIIYATTLCTLNPSKVNLYNRALLLMDLYENDNVLFLEDEIVESLKKITKLYPDFKTPYYHLGRYFINKDRDLSKFYLKECLDDTNISEEAQKLIEKIDCIDSYDEAVSLVKNGMGAEAINTLIHYIDYDPENPNAKYYLAMALRQCGYYDKALFYLKDVAEYGPSADVLCEMGLNYACMHDYDCALDNFIKAHNLKNNDCDILCNIGVCYLNTGDASKAKKYFKMAHDIDPNDNIANEWLTKINNI